MNDYRDALEDCLQVMRSGGDVQAAIAQHPQHATELRNDIALAAAIRGAGARVETPAGAEGRAGLRMAAALRELRTTEASRLPAPRAGIFGNLGAFLRPIAIAGIAMLVLAVGLGVIGGLGGGGTAEASTLEGVVVENSNGTLQVQTNTGLETVSFENSAQVQDESSNYVAVADIAVGQVIKAQGKASNGRFVAKQALSKSPAEIKTFCTDHPDACQQLLPRLEAQINACTPAGSPACQRLQQPLQDTRNALQALTTELTNLKDRCEGGNRNACKARDKSCKQHPLICSELQKHNGNNGPTGPGNNGPRPNGGPGRPGPRPGN